MQKIWWQIAATLTLIFVLSSAYLLLPQTFLSLDNRLRDFLFILRGPVPASSNIVIIDIDEKSLKAEGQWPWPRNRVAQLIQNLSDADAGIIGLDMVFAEEDKRSPHTIISSLPSFQGEVDNYDETLAKTIASTPTIGGYFFTYAQSEKSETPLIPAVFVERKANDQEFIVTPRHLVLNIPLIQNAFYSSGFFNTTHDEGGMIRRVPLVMRYDDTIYPSLALEMVRIFTDAKQVYVNNSLTGVDSIDLNKLHIPTDRFAHLMVNYRGPQNSFKYISAIEILNGSFNQDDVNGKFILVGTSAVGIADLRATPYDTVMPGVEVHANVIDNLLEQDFISLPENTEIIDLAMISATVILMMILFSFANAWLVLPLFIAMGYSLYLLLMYTLFEQGMVLNILFPVAALFISFMAAILLNYIVSLRQKQLIMAVFAKKVSPTVMHDLIQNSSDTLLKPKNREVTVFFSDIRSFTAISEKLANPERVISMLNTYMTPMVDAITRHHGTVDKFIGDAVMAYWNAPVEVTNHADEAVEAALEQISLLKDLNVELLQTYNIEIQIGIGIHTGEVTIGEMGSIGRSDYTVIGDNVNLASRLEGLTKMYGASIIISAETKRQLKQHYNIRSLDIVKVKGKEKAVEIFEVMAQTKVVSEDEIHHYETALTLYRAKNLKEALAAFTSLQQEFDSSLYTLYVKRCQQALDVGKESFEPITTMQTK